MAEETAATEVPLEDATGDAPTGDTTPPAAPPSGRGQTDPSPEDTAPAGAPTGDSGPPNPAEPVKGDDLADPVDDVEIPSDQLPDRGVPDAGDSAGGAVEEAVEGATTQDDFTESGASPEPDGEFNEAPPAAPEVIDSNDLETVAGGATAEDGSQQFLLDTDGDGLFDTSATGVPIGDRQFKVIESSPLDEPIPDPRGGSGSTETTEDNAPIVAADPEDPDGGEKLLDDAEAGPPVDVPEPGEFIDSNEVDVVETRPGVFEADLDGDGVNDVEFRGRVGEDGLIEVGRARPIGDDAGTGEINEDNADEAGNAGGAEITEDNADEAGTGKDADDGVRVIDEGDGGPPVDDPKVEIPKDGGSDELDVIDDPADRLRPDGEAPPPGGIDEKEEIQPDKEPDPADRLLPDDDAPPVDGEAPVAPPAGEHAPPGDAEVDLPELYDAPPPYASGSDGGDHAPAAGNGEQSTTVPADDPGTGVPDLPVPADDCEPETDDGADEPIEVNAKEDGDDPGLLEQVADAVGDLWDDAKDVVT